MDIPYLKAPIFADDLSLHVGGGARRAVSTDKEREIFNEIVEGGMTVEDLAARLVDQKGGQTVYETCRSLKAAFENENSAIGLISVELKPTYDIIVVEQGYGGVYVHTVELLKRLGRRWSCLLLCPEDPLFEDGSGTDIVTLKGIRKRIPDFSYFSFVHLVRTLVRRTPSQLLLLTHRSQSIFLFDVIGTRRTVIYCDGFVDGGFSHARNFKLADTAMQRRQALMEVYYIIANGDPNFFGIHPSPNVNYHLLVAGCFAVRDALENWCWGAQQTRNFAQGFPELLERIKFVPPFTDPELFRPELVERDKRVLFTTTMHNIKKKGLPELLRAMHRIGDMRVRCVVRQPQHLPPIPSNLRKRMEISGLTKSEIVVLYHKVWLNCRVSREESSPVSILEAMICEVPQVTSTAVAEQIPIIEDGKTGFVVNPDDTAGLVRGLRRLLADPALRDEMGRECRRRAVSYSLESRIGVFEELAQ